MRILPRGKGQGEGGKLHAALIDLQSMDVLPQHRVHRLSGCETLELHAHGHQHQEGGNQEVARAAAGVEGFQFGKPLRPAVKGSGRELPKPLSLGERGWGEGVPQRFQHRIRFLQYLIVPEANHPNALFIQEPGALRIIFPDRISVMLTSIQFDRQLQFVAVEVENISAYRMLTPEFFVGKPTIAEQTP